MIFKIAADINMVNACVRLEKAGYGFEADLGSNHITATEDLAEVTAIIEDEGGVECTPFNFQFTK